MEGSIVAKKTTKAPAKKLISAQSTTKAAEPAQEPAAQAAAPKPKAPVLPPKPVPAHQQFLSKGVKPHAMTKARIIRHQGR
jgi:hypothetical protein